LDPAGTAKADGAQKVSASDQPGHRITRRGALAGAALVGIGAGLDRLAGGVGGGSSSEGDAASAVPFHGAHQAGIATSQPEYLEFATFDLDSDAPDQLRGLLQKWTGAAASLAKGGSNESEGAEDPRGAPADPGEAVGLGPAQLTITFGFGPSLLEGRRAERLGLGRRRPSALRPLPPFQGESLEPDRCGGDLCVQACAEDPQVAFHAVHVLTRIAGGTATLRWSQQGFGRTSSTSRDQPTPRNLMGFKDGTNNVRGEDEKAMNEHVWVQSGDGPAWMEGGTYLVARRIKMLLDVWDVTSLEGQERAIGRKKVSGAPLGSADEFDPVDLDAREGGQPVIPHDSHVRLASPESNGEQRILRRGFSYAEPALAGSGQIDAGLFFISFQRDPTRQFVPMQRQLAASDALSRHILHTGSAVFACPPGTEPGGFVGEGLFA